MADSAALLTENNKDTLKDCCCKDMYFLIFMLANPLVYCKVICINYSSLLFSSVAMFRSNEFASISSVVARPWW